MPTVAGVVVTPLTPGQWTTFAIRPDDDVTALWPDLDVRDFQLSGITVNAVSTGDTVTGYVDYLRFDRQMSGAAQLSMQEQMELLLAPRYPTVQQRQGLEVSWLLPHLNWFGGAVVLPDGLATVTSKNYASWLNSSAVPCTGAVRPSRLPAAASAAGSCSRVWIVTTCDMRWGPPVCE